MHRSGNSPGRSRVGIIADRTDRRVAGWAEWADALDAGKGKMKLPQTGGCLCGKIRYEISEAPRLVYTCHGTECQHLTSSAFSIALAVAGFRVTGDEPQPLESTADSGRVKIRWVCPVCGCWLFSTGKPGDGLHRVRGWHAGRYLMAAPNYAFLDPQKTALDNAAQRRSNVRDAAGLGFSHTPPSPLVGRRCQ